MIKYLWGMVNSLQMIVLTVLFNLTMPEEAKVVLKEIMKYCNLDIV